MKLADPSHIMRQADARNWAQKNLLDLEKTFTDGADILMSASYRDAIKAISSAAETAARKYSSEVLHNSKLTDEGKGEEAAKIALEVQDTITAQQKAIDRITEKIAAVEATVITEQPAGDPTLNYLQQMEIRQRLATVPDLELRVQYERAVNAGEFSPLVEALEADPLPRYFVTDQTRAQSKHNRAKTLNPAQVQQIEKLVNAREALSRYTSIVKSLV
ncbi:MAG: hypothetical protein IH613_13530 [Desulfuromonadales bacterium]|nr:hypothetical protein [Desulfuromonadales bacterium]